MIPRSSSQRTGLPLPRPSGSHPAGAFLWVPSSLAAFSPCSRSCDFGGSSSRNWVLESLDRSKAWQVGEWGHNPAQLCDLGLVS